MTTAKASASTGIFAIYDGEHALAAPYNALYHEILVFWYFTWRDWSASFVPGMMYTIAALRSLDAPLSTELVVSSLTRSLIYFLLYIYAFDIANQINGIDEDRINKPDRPLASGRVSLQGAYIRWYITTFAHLCVGAAWGVLPWTALWVFITIYTSFYGGDKHWTTKNLLFMSVGSLCLLQAAWGLVAPLTPKTSHWAVLFSCLFGIVASVQDVRDVEGDKVSGRRTLPIVLGDHFRWAMALIICASQAVFWYLDFLAGYCGAALGLSMFYLAYSVFVGRSRKEDHKSYMLLTYIYCGFVAVRMIFP